MHAESCLSLTDTSSWNEGEVFEEWDATCISELICDRFIKIKEAGQWRRKPIYQS